jgi:predicted TPR repeat methyltransferase
MDEGDLVAAKEGYEQVLALGPDFPDALRRLSSVELELDHVESALQHAEQAYAADPSPYNQSALARALLYTEDPSTAPEALSHA